MVEKIMEGKNRGRINKKELEYNRAFPNILKYWPKEKTLSKIGTKKSAQNALKI